VTEPVVKPVIPADVAAPAPPRAGSPLPLAGFSVPDAGPMVAAVVTMDRDGRVADAAVLAALGWPVGTHLDIRISGGLILVSADPHGVFRLARAGQIRIPAAARHRCGLMPGNRLLVTADAGRLVVHPPAHVARMVADFHAAVFDGGEGQ
jgi:hypothetical protein